MRSSSPTFLLNTVYAELSTQKRASWFGTRISKSFVGSATAADDDAGALWDELLTSLRMLEELFSSLRELEDFGSSPE